MALPTFQGVGTAAESSTGNITPTWPTHQADDIALCFVETANEVVTAPASWTGDTGWAEVADSPQGIGTGGAATGGRLSIFWRRATSGSMTNPTIPFTPGDHIYAVILTFRGCITSGNPWDVTAGATESTGSAFSIPGDTTSVADCLIVAATSWSRDASTAQVASFTNADLANIAERHDQGTSLGNGGGVSVCTGEKATAGAYGATTGFIADGNAAKGLISIALKPPGGGTTPVSRDASLTWNVRDEVNHDASLTWNVRDEVSRDASLTWNVREEAAVDAPLAWNVRAAVSRDADLAWNVAAQVSRDVESTWNVRESILRDAALSWNVLAAIFRDATLEWNVESSLTSVFRDAALAWHVNAQVSRDAAMTWNVIGQVSRDASLAWDVLTTVNRDAGLAWHVLTSISRDADLRWNVRAPIYRDAVLRWNTLSDVIVQPLDVIELRAILTRKIELRAQI